MCTFSFSAQRDLVKIFSRASKELISGFFLYHSLIHNHFPLSSLRTPSPTHVNMSVCICLHVRMRARAHTHPPTHTYTLNLYLREEKRARIQRELWSPACLPRQALINIPTATSPACLIKLQHSPEQFPLRSLCNASVHSNLFSTLQKEGSF